MAPRYTSNYQAIKHYTDTPKKRAATAYFPISSKKSVL